MKVTATKRGFIYGLLREPGDKFECKSDKEFSKNWMSKDGFVPEKLDNSKVETGEQIERPALEIPGLKKRKRRTKAEMKEDGSK
ncbi:MAG: hypothetical protein COB69_00180 [Phycisphaera sp.]|nr:MAG: hypothetical protein COB69_00180 [Phycisphaera sp.]